MSQDRNEEQGVGIDIHAGLFPLPEEEQGEQKKLYIVGGGEEREQVGQEGGRNSGAGGSTAKPGIVN